MGDYTQAIYKAVCCKKVTQGATMFIDDFGDVWTMIPQVNRFGELSQYRQYSGNLVVSDRPLFNDMTGGHLYLGELIPSYHFNLRNPANFINGLQHQLLFYMQGRLGKVQARYLKKPLRFKG